MKKKVLCIVATHFQLMVAVQLRSTEYQEADFDILIRDYTLDYKNIAKKVSDTKLFNHVFTCEAKAFLGRKGKIVKGISYVDAILCPDHFLKKHNLLLNGKYTELLFYNTDIFSQMIYMKLLKNNTQVICKKFEEGYTFYLEDDKGYYSPTVECLCKIFRKKSVLQEISGYYVFYPENVQWNPGKCVIKKIKVFSRDDMQVVAILNKIFSFEKREWDIQQKYIFFETIYFLEHQKNSDVELLEKIAAIAGKENILVKRHPRGEIDRFSDRGFLVAKNQSTMPWEIVQLNLEMKNKIMLTVDSSSALASSLYFDDNCKSVLFFKLLKEKNPAIGEGFFRLLDVIEKKSNHHRLYIPSDFDELKGLIEQDFRVTGG
ncbi:MAG: hypothetical protein LUH14_13190 [Clostridiaceae bacterium]|nr:hypothetical protein [Clostridiaceae bacterium]